MKEKSPRASAGELEGLLAGFMEPFVRAWLEDEKESGYRAMCPGCCGPMDNAICQHESCRVGKALRYIDARELL